MWSTMRLERSDRILVNFAWWRLKIKPVGRQSRTEVPPASRAELSRTAAPIHPWRFLVQFVILLAAMLLLWHVVLLEPLLALSRGAIEVSFSLLPLPGGSSAELIRVDSNGDWIVLAPHLLLPEREITRQAFGSREAGVRIQRELLPTLSLCLPIFWALALAARPGKRFGRVLGIGTLLLAIISQLSLVVFLAYWTDNYFVVASSPWTRFGLQVIEYLSLNVVPYAAPLVVVISLDRGLRSLLFGESIPRIWPRPRA